MLVHKVQTVSCNTDKEFLQGFLTTYQVGVLDQSVYFSQYVLIHNKLVENILLLSILASQRVRITVVLILVEHVLRVMRDLTLLGILLLL